MTIDPRDDLAALSREFGVDPTFTRAGGVENPVCAQMILARELCA